MALTTATDPTQPPVNALTNLTFDQIDIGASLVIHHTVTRHEVELMALVSGEANPFAPREGAPADDGPVP